MIMKDPIVREIHRHRAAHAKRFSYDVHAIGEDIRRSEAEAGGKFAAKTSRMKRVAKRVRKASPKR
jgi:N-formylglutamate amidohydrolase